MPLQAHRRISLTAFAGMAVYAALLTAAFLLGSDAGRIDLKSNYWAVQLAFRQQASPYGPDAFATHGLDLDPWLYPPLTLTLLWPLANLTWEHTWQLVRLLAIGCSLATALALYRQARPVLGSLPRTAAYWALLVGFLPVWLGLGMGQSDSLLLALFLLGTHGWRRGWLWLPALLFAVCIGIRIYFVLLLPWMLVRRDWAMLGSTLACLAALLATNLATLGTSIWAHWFATMMPVSGYGNDIPGLVTEIRLNQSLNGFWVRTLLEQGITQPASALRLLPYASSLLLVGLTLARLRSARAHPPLQQDALLLLAMCLVSPLLWGSHFVLALPAAACCLVQACQSRAWRRAGYALLALLLASNPMLSGLFWTHPLALAWPWSLLASGPLYTLLAAWCLLLPHRRDN